MTIKLTDPLLLPCGVELSNRLCKAAMTEGLADAQNRASDRHLRLYESWAAARVGLSLSGNIHIDRRHLERAGNIAVDGNGGEESLARLVRTVRADGTQFWAQINHAGRQSPAPLCPQPIAPSPVQLQMKGAHFVAPREATEAELVDIIRRFAQVAEVTKGCGFTGAQIHAAHGYLLSEFLSPLANRRNDRWGGSLENRARLLVEVCRAVREAVGPDYPISVKLNSADLQKGGFSHDESLTVLQILDAENVDLVEISGGNYEDAGLLFGDKDANGRVLRDSTRRREEYFLDYARKARQVRRKPLMVTGGFRSRAAMEAALESGELDMIGLARPLVCDPASAARLLDGSDEALPRFEDRLRPLQAQDMPDLDEDTLKTVNIFGHLGWFYMNIFHIGAGQPPRLDATLADSARDYPPMEEAVINDWDSPWT